MADIDPRSGDQNQDRQVFDTTSSTAAKAIGVADQTIRRWEARGVLPSIRTSTGQRLFRRCDVDRLAAARRTLRGELAHV